MLDSDPYPNEFGIRNPAARELERLEQIKQSHERLEAERRHFEDLEFRHMEEESILEADRDEVRA
jgi:hypothetical protein